MEKVRELEKKNPDRNWKTGLSTEQLKEMESHMKIKEISSSSR